MVAPLVIDPGHEHAQLCGAIIDPNETAMFMSMNPIKTYSSLPRESGLGKKRFLWDYVRQVLGPLGATDPEIKAVVGQLGDFHELQTQGTCVSKALQRVIVYLWCIRLTLQGLAERFPGIPASEAIYALGRIEIGKGKLGYDSGQGRRNDNGGLVVSWGLQAAMKYGILLRNEAGEPYPGNVDLSRPNDNLAVQWGNPGHGLPDQLEPIAKHLVIRAAAPVKSWDDLCTALYNGEPIYGGCDHIPSNGATRNAKGYIPLGGSGGHSTVIDGYDDTGVDDDPWFFYNNASWPAVSGPNPVNAPIYGGKAPRRFFESVMLREGEWFALSDIESMPNQAALFDMM